MHHWHAGTFGLVKCGCKSCFMGYILYVLWIVLLSNYDALPQNPPSYKTIANMSDENAGSVNFVEFSNFLPHFAQYRIILFKSYNSNVFLSVSEFAE